MDDLYYKDTNKALIRLKERPDYFKSSVEVLVLSDEVNMLLIEYKSKCSLIEDLYQEIQILKNNRGEE